jgi:hypothetical protein
VGTTWWRYTWHTTVGLGALAFSVAAMVGAILQLVDIGTCASHPALVSVRPCPENVGPLIALASAMPILGMVGWAVYATRVDRRRPSAFDEGPDWSILAWPGLFVGTTSAFVRAAESFRAQGDAGQAAGMWATGAVFLLMGLAPLAVGWRGLGWLIYGGTRPAPPFALLQRLQAVTTKGATAASATAATDASATDASPAAAAPPPPAATQDDGDVVAALERLAALHRAGHLDDAEFSRAKSRVLRGARGEGR